MSDELKQWCDDNGFDVTRFTKLNLNLEKIAATKSRQIILLCEELKMTSTDERTKLMNAVLALKEKEKDTDKTNTNNDNNNNNIADATSDPDDDADDSSSDGDDDDVIVHNDDDDDDDDDDDVIIKNDPNDNNQQQANHSGGNYEEFDDNYDEKKSIQDENFMLRSNFSDDPLDQWDIVSYFDSNKKFQEFKPILMLQMQIQNNANFQDPSNDNQNQLDHLLNNMLDGNNQNVSSSDSDDDVYDEERDSNTFRDYINMGFMPSSTSLIYDVLLNEYSFDLNSNNNNIRGDNDTDALLPIYPSISYAQTTCYDNNIENYLTIHLNNNILSSLNNYARHNLNLIIILETSALMNDSFNNSSSNCQIIGNKIVCNILNKLSDSDRFSLVTFNDTFNILAALDEISSIDIKAISSSILSLAPRGGGCDFDEGFNAALGQLQELFDVLVLQQTNDDDNDDNKSNSNNEYENRIIVVSSSLPNPDSSLIDLMRVYSDSDENKVYTSFLNIGDIEPSFKLTSGINKMRGCNIMYYGDDAPDDIIQNVDDSFRYIINPLFFNVSLTVNQLTNHIDTIFGYYNNIRKINKLSSSGLVKYINTLWLNNNILINDDRDIITIRLQSLDDDDDDDNNEYKLNVLLNYEHFNGKIGENNRDITLNINKKDGIFDNSNQSYYDNISIQKRILLIKYCELLNEWVAKDTKNNEMHLNVSKIYKDKFINFAKIFKYQMDQIKDKNLQKDAEILTKLINFDQKEAEMLRKIATFDK